MTLGPQLEYSVLNPDGPFVLLNPTIRLPSGETQVLDLSFSPRESVVVSPSPPKLHCSPIPCSACRPALWAWEPLALLGPGLSLEEGGGGSQGAPSHLRSPMP